MTDDVAQVTYRDVWRRDAPDEQRNALDFWETQAILPATVDPREQPNREQRTAKKLEGIEVEGMPAPDFSSERFDVYLLR